MPLLEQELLTLPQHLSSTAVFSGVRDARSVPVLHNRKNEYILVFPPERSVYTHLSSLILGGEIWVYAEVSPSYSILPLCTDRLYNQIKFWFRRRPFDFISKMEKKNRNPSDLPQSRIETTTKMKINILIWPM
jgi:hypothetical protein